VAGDSTRKRELLEEPLHALFVLRDVRVHLGVRPLEIHIRHQCGSAVTGPGDVDNAEVAGVDDAVQMDVDEVQSRRRAPVAEQSRLDV
jgi:hypothetical protein